MNYPPANLWMIVQMDPKPEPEPEMIEVHSKLRLPASWDKERRKLWYTALGPESR